MKKYNKIIVAITLSLLALQIHAQERSADINWAFGELSRMRHASTQSFFHVGIAVRNNANPISSPEDTMNTNVKLIMAKDYYYFKSEGLEYILKDSLQIAVNERSKQIQVYKTTPEKIAAISGSALHALPDSTLHAMEARYNCTVTETNQSKRILFTSKKNVEGTSLPKEKLLIVYNPNNYQPSQVSVTTVKLVLIDSAVYHQLDGGTQFRNRLVKTSGNNGNLFFLAKEQTQTSSYRFSAGTQAYSAKISERVKRSKEGRYTAAKGYEHYQVLNYTEL